jgi:hypothetical protein
VNMIYVDELILKNAWDLYCEWWHVIELMLSIAWDLYCEYDICWWIDIEDCMGFVLWIEMW